MESVDVYVQGKFGDPDIAIQQRIDLYRPRFEEAFEDVEYGGDDRRFLTTFVCDGGTRNFWTWDTVANWLKDHRAKYEEILRA